VYREPSGDAKLLRFRFPASRLVMFGPIRHCPDVIGDRPSRRPDELHCPLQLLKGGFRTRWFPLLAEITERQNYMRWGFFSPVFEKFEDVDGRFFVDRRRQDTESSSYAPVGPVPVCSVAVGKSSPSVTGVMPLAFWVAFQLSSIVLASSQSSRSSTVMSG
jgi:hypothetical protein